MVTVTASAAEKIRGDLQAAATDPEVAIRLIPSPTAPNQIQMILDKEKEGDQVVESEGVKILLLDSEIAPALEGMVIDYEESPQGGKFSLSKLAPDT
jgi:Fe-S cluster assembly iron-binding protein IscA